MACVIHKFYDLTQLWIGISNGRSPIHCPRDLERRKRNCEHRVYQGEGGALPHDDDCHHDTPLCVNRRLLADVH